MKKIQMFNSQIIAVLTLEIIIPAMEILTLGCFRSLYLKSIPFQKLMTYRFIAMLSFPWSLKMKMVLSFMSLKMGGGHKPCNYVTFRSYKIKIYDRIYLP